MRVVALETDRAQASAIRHVVCDLAGAQLTVVESVDRLMQALGAESPELMLLPALIPPAADAALVEFLRTVPEHAHVETLITPMLRQPGPTATNDPRWRRWGGRRPSTSPMPSTDFRIFAERVVWCLDRARERRAVAPGPAAAGSLVGTMDSASLSADTLLVDAPTSLLRILSDVAGDSDGERLDAGLSDTTARLLQKMNADRRVHRRFSMNELHGVRGARIRFGPHVSLIDVSAGGALVESETRLPPESEATLELIASTKELAVPFRVLRCQVAALGQSMRYRGACVFKRPLDLSELLLEASGIPDTLALVPRSLEAGNAW